MGNSASSKKSDSRRVVGRTSLSPYGSYGDHLRTEPEINATAAFIEEQNRFYHEAQVEAARRRAEEAQRKAEETQREAWRKAEEAQRDARRKAEEAQRQAEEARRQAEEARQKQAQAPPLHILLPQLCRRHSSRQGCTDSKCRLLHLCRLFLADICKFGVTCRYVHSLTTVHNQMVCNLHHLDTVDELASLQQLRRAFEETEQLPESLYRNNLEICYKYSSKNSCYANDCKRIHICRQYITGACARAACKYGHNLTTKHNNQVLTNHRLRGLTGTEIRDILRRKETGEADRNNESAAVTSSAGNGAIPRRAAPAAASGPSDAGLCDELQCPICLELFSGATTLGCGHTFCADCLRDARHSSGDRCPVCRAHISSAIRSVTLDNVVRSVAGKQ